MLKILFKPMKWFVFLLFLSVLVFALVIFYQKHTRETVDFTGTHYQECWTEALNVIGAKCGLMSVPLSYKDKTNGNRAFSFAILPAIESAEKNIPLIFLIGGPGPAGTYFAQEFKSGAPGAFFRQDRDVVLIDYRGSGMSIPHDGCEMPSGILSGILCIKSSYVANTDEFRSAIFAKDINSLIDTLGYESVVLYGGSYGTRLALTMMRDTPDYISHVIIDGVFPVEVNGFSQGHRSLLAGLAMIADRCKDNEDCNDKFGAIRPKIEKLQEKWKDREDAAYLFSYLASYSYFPQAPILIHQLAELPSDESAKLLIDIVYPDSKNDPQKKKDEEDSSRSMSIPLSLGVTCSEESAYSHKQPLDNKRHGFSNELIQTISDISLGAPFSPSQAKMVCGLLGVAKAPSIEIEPVNSNIPTLILSGGMDLQTSFEWGELAKNNLSAAKHYIVPFSNHMVIFDQDNCGRSMIEQFISTPDGEINTSCLKRYPIEPFLLESDDIRKEFKHPYNN